MARASKIDRLPAEIRETIAALRRDGRTIDEILAHLRTLGVEDVSRSGLGEHVKRYARMAERLHASRAASDAIMARLEDTSADDRVMRFNIGVLHASIMELMRGEDGEAPDLKPSEAAQIAKALKDLATAARSDQVRYAEAVRQLEQARARVEALDRVVDEAAEALEGGISGARAAELRRKLLGVRRPPAAGGAP